MSVLGACSIYDPSLLGSNDTGGADGGGNSTSGGKSTASGGVGNVEGGSATSTPGGSGSDGGEPDASGGTTGGSLATGGNGNSTLGGASATGGATSTGSATGTGGASATGGTTSTGGTLATGGASKGGTTSTGGATGGVTATGGATGSGGAGGCSGGDCCPTDPNKTAPGVCGCGIPDQDSGTSAGCVGLKSALVHRYSFSGTGTRVSDSIGTAHGTIVNATLGNTGALTLAGTTSDQYVDLPNGILSSLSNATIEVWLTWGGGSSFQRVFDFGSSTAVEGAQGAGVTYLFLTPKGSTPAYLTATFSSNGVGNETFVTGTAALPSNVVSHLSVVVDNANELFSLYLNGSLVGSAAFTGALSNLSDVNNWLGRSQYAADAELAGTLQELRIYKVALSAAQVQLTQQTGTDPAFF